MPKSHFMWENLNEKIIYAPELQDYFGDIMFINDLINKDNKKHDMAAFFFLMSQKIVYLTATHIF